MINISRAQLTQMFLFYVVFSEIKKTVLVYRWKDASERECVCSVKKGQCLKIALYALKGTFGKASLSFFCLK